MEYLKLEHLDTTPDYVRVRDLDEVTYYGGKFLHLEVNGNGRMYEFGRACDAKLAFYAVKMVMAEHNRIGWQDSLDRVNDLNAALAGLGQEGILCSISERELH